LGIENRSLNLGGNNKIKSQGIESFISSSFLIHPQSSSSSSHFIPQLHYLEFFYFLRLINYSIISIFCYLVYLGVVVLIKEEWKHCQHFFLQPFHIPSFLSVIYSLLYFLVLFLSSLSLSLFILDLSNLCTPKSTNHPPNKGRNELCDDCRSLLLFDALSSHPSLQWLKLNGNPWISSLFNNPNYSSMSSSFLNPNIQTNNGIKIDDEIIESEQSSSPLSRFISSTQSLTSLHLSHCNLSYYDAQILSQSLVS